MPSHKGYGATKAVREPASFLTSGTQRSQPVEESGFTGTANSFCSLRTLQTSPKYELVLEVRAFLLIYAPKNSSDFPKFPFTHSVSGIFTMASVAISKLCIWDMWNGKAERGRNQGTNKGYHFLHLFSISIMTSGGEYVLAPSNSEKGCLFQHTPEGGSTH